MKRREVPSPYDGSDGTIPELQARGRPFSPMEALMSAGPHQEPEGSILEGLALRDIVADALDELDERDRRLVEARVIEKRSLRSLEEELGWGKSYIHQREAMLLQWLAERLEEHPTIKEYLQR